MSEWARTSRRGIIGVSTLVVGAVLATAAGIAPASAATVITVTTAADLGTALSAATPDTFVDLGAAIDASASGPLTIADSVTLDLEGNALSTASLQVASGATLRILDSRGGGSLSAVGASGDAGIEVTPGAALVISGATVTATGGDGGAGIGGRSGEGAGDIQVTSGIVRANAGGGGASGIGAGSAAGTGAGNLLVLGGAVTADANGAGSAAIGGGTSDGVIAIGSGATVTTGNLTSDPYAAIGTLQAQPAVTSTFDSLDISGALTIGGAGSIAPVSGATVAVHKSGRILGTAGASIAGAGTVSNGGSIAGIDLSAAAVTGNKYAVTFVPNAADAIPSTSSTVTVYAADLADAGLALPAVTRTNWELTRWFASADNSTFTATTALTADVTVKANWGFSHIALAPSGSTAPRVHMPTTFVATGETAALTSVGDHTSDVTITSSDPSDVVSGATVTFGSVGARTITATSKLDSSVIGTAVITVSAGVIASVKIDQAATSLVTGTSKAFTATGYDTGSNSLGAVAVTLKSSDSTDVVTGSTGTIKFLKPGVRTVTATNGSISGTVTITVTAGVIATPTVTITGSPSFGKTLTGHISAASVSGAKTVYQWYRGSSKISGATSLTHKVLIADLGHPLHLRATRTATYFTTVIVNSAAVDVAKDAVTLTVTAPTTLKVGAAGTISVAMKAGKTKIVPTGTIKLYVNGKAVKTLTLTAKNIPTTAVPWLVAIAAKAKGTTTIYALYSGASAYAKKKSKTHSIKVS